MSLILEALKKSEAERGGQAPVAAGSTVGTRRGRHKLVAGMAAIALVGAVAGWWGSRQWAAPEAPTTADQPTPQRSASDAPAAVDEDAARSAAEIEDADFGSGLAAASPTETPPGLSEDAPGAPADGQETGGDPPTVAARAQDAAPSIPSAPPAQPRLVTVAGPSQSGPVRPGPAVAPPATAAEPLRAGAAAEPAGTLPRFDELPGLGAEFGKLKLNMLVYATRPEARFALINLRRFEEGDQLEPGLQLKEIRRDGVVLSLRGQDVLLPSGH